jgi:hypothetical protein
MLACVRAYTRDYNNTSLSHKLPVFTTPDLSKGIKTLGYAIRRNTPSVQDIVVAATAIMVEAAANMCAPSLSGNPSSAPCFASQVVCNGEQSPACVLLALPW